MRENLGVLPATAREVVERKLAGLRLAHDYLDQLELTRVAGI